MPKHATKTVARVTPWTVLALATVVPAVITVVPAQAQDFLWFFRPFPQPMAPRIPVYQPPTESSPLTVRVRPRRKVVRADKPPSQVSSISMASKPKDPGEIANPVPALLADSTLRSGDLIMFPDGLRVFTGRSGTDHALSAFEPLSRSGEAVPATTRKLVAQLRPGSNSAWSADAAKASGKLAHSTKAAETTGGLRRRTP